MPFITMTDVTAHEPIAGFTGRFVHAESMTLAYWDIEAGRRVPEHDHPHEMMINCLSGTFEVTIDGETRTLNPGDVAVVPSHAKHAAHAVTACRVLDVFSPVREDYRALG